MLGYEAPLGAVAQHVLLSVSLQTEQSRPHFENVVDWGDGTTSVGVPVQGPGSLSSRGDVAVDGIGNWSAGTPADASKLRSFGGMAPCHERDAAANSSRTLPDEALHATVLSRGARYAGRRVFVCRLRDRVSGEGLPVRRARVVVAPLHRVAATKGSSLRDINPPSESGLGNPAELRGLVALTSWGLSVALCRAAVVVAQRILQCSLPIAAEPVADPAAARRGLQKALRVCRACGWLGDDDASERAGASVESVRLMHPTSMRTHARGRGQAAVEHNPRAVALEWAARKRAVSAISIGCGRCGCDHTDSASCPLLGWPATTTINSRLVTGQTRPAIRQAAPVHAVTLSTAEPTFPSPSTGGSLTIELAIPEARPGKRAAHADDADAEANVLQNVRARRGSTVAELYGRILDAARRQVRGASSVDFGAIEEGLRNESLTSAEAFVRALKGLGHDSGISAALVDAAVAAGSVGQPLGDGLAALQARRPKLGRVVLAFDSAEARDTKCQRTERTPVQDHDVDGTNNHDHDAILQQMESTALPATRRSSFVPNTDLVRIRVITA